MNKILNEIKKEYGFSIPQNTEFVKTDGDLKVVIGKEGSTVYYKDKRDIARAAFLIEAQRGEVAEIVEKNTFDDVCLMVDCSRNGVLNVPTAKRLMLTAAMLGYNSFMLYTEDTYEVNGEPEFGYLRGRYTKAELKELDAYSLEIGIELIPCIQTLAHLNGLNRYYKSFMTAFDVDNVLLCGEERVYKLIENIFSTLEECFTTRRVHIGMDEAGGMGRGAYLTKHGYRDPFDIFIEHLTRVAKIAENHGFKAIMWSDMFFKIAHEKKCVNESGEIIIPPEVIDKIPSNVTVCHWDYRDTADESYVENFKIHRCYKTPVWYAGSSFKFGSFFPSVTYSLRGIDLGLKTSEEYGIKSVMNTLWGDNGAECSVWSALPCVLYFSYRALKKSDDEIKKHFKTLTGMTFEEFASLEYPNTLMGKETRDPASPAMSFLYNDLFSGQFDCYVTDDYIDTFKRCAEMFKGGKDNCYSYLFETAYRLTDVLTLKADMGIRLRNAYKAKNTVELEKIVDDLETLKEKLDLFMGAVRKQWLKDNKPNGLEVQEYRIGGLKERVNGCRLFLKDYLNGVVDTIPELEETLLNDVLASSSPFRIFYVSFVLSATNNNM